MELLEPGFVASSQMGKMGEFGLSSQVPPCSETCYTTSTKMPKELSAGSEAFSLQLRAGCDF